MIIICWVIGFIYFRKFLHTQDELMHRYYLTTMASGGVGFISVGMLFSIIDPYIDLTIGFYGYFVAFAIGTVVGGFLFDKKYLSDGE
jgi:ribose/xylose/arabinose/galactoside ABC-type transport system permease subunit